jgi:hypothetical protein
MAIMATPVAPPLLFINALVEEIVKNYSPGAILMAIGDISPIPFAPPRRPVVISFNHTIDSYYALNKYQTTSPSHPLELDITNAYRPWVIIVSQPLLTNASSSYYISLHN